MTQTLRPASAAEVNIDLSRVPADEEADARDFARYTAERDAGLLADEDFRRIRLNNGIYGIRGEDRLHMVRVKVPQGLLNPAQLRVLAKISDEKSRGFGHLTTRQCLQFHLVQIEEIPTVMRWIASVGLTTREACGDTVRNVQADHLAGVAPDEPFDVTPWARAITDHFLRNPAFQRFPRKFKLNFSGSDADRGQALINDIGAIATVHPETGAPGFRLFLGGGLGTTPHEAHLLEEHTAFEDVIPTFEAVARVFDRNGNRKNRNRARLKWLVDTLGIEELREQIFAERRAVIAVSGVNTGIPDSVIAAGAHELKGEATLAVPPDSTGDARFDAWLASNVVATTDGLFAAYATTFLGDLTTAQLLGLADVMEDGGWDDLRATNRQNIVIRAVDGARLHELWQRLDALGLGEAHVHAAADPVACPGADTCNIAITQSRGLAKAIRAKVLDEGLGGVPVRINMSGCSNSCGQHHLADVGFFGTERRVGTTPAPAYQMLLAGGLGAEKADFGMKVAKLGAKQVPNAVVAVLRRYESEREANEPFKLWAERIGRDPLAEMLATFAEIPSITEDPDAYVDWDETETFAVSLGQSECL